MPNNTPVFRRLPRAGVPLLLILFVLQLPLAAAQDPPTLPEAPTLEELEQSQMGIALSTDSGYARVPYNGNAATRITVHDMSQDTGRTAATGGVGFDAKPHYVDLKVLNREEVDAAGWQVQIGSTSLQMFGGQTQDVDVNFVTTPQISQRVITATVIAEFFDGQTGYRTNQTINLTGEVMPYSLGNVRMLTFPQTVGQFEVHTFDVLVTNDAVYPDEFTIDARMDKDGFVVIAPASVYIPAKETRTVTINIRTPYGTFYEWGNNANLKVDVSSVRGGTFSVVGIMKVEGFYISSYWTPLLLVGAVSLGVVIRDRNERAELRRLEKGRPRRVQPTPRQTVLLAELKRTDPETFKEKKARMDTLYKARRETYRDEHKRVVESDRAERKQARIEYAAAMARKKMEKKEQRRLASIERKEARARAKVENKEAKRQAKVDAKERKRLQKVVGKKRKKLEKVRHKQAKVDAKQTKLDAKAAAKAERVAAKAAKAEARAAKKAAKGRNGKP